MKKFIVILSLVLVAAWVIAGVYEEHIIVDGTLTKTLLYSNAVEGAIYTPQGVVKANTNLSALATEQRAITNAVLVPASTVAWAISGVHKGDVGSFTVTTQKSYDKKTWENLLVHNVPLADNGTTTVINTFAVVTNATLTDFGYFRISNIVNENAGTADYITNLVIRVFHK